VCPSIQNISASATSPWAVRVQWNPVDEKIRQVVVRVTVVNNPEFYTDETVVDRRTTAILISGIALANNAPHPFPSPLRVEVTLWGCVGPLMLRTPGSVPVYVTLPEVEQIAQTTSTPQTQGSTIPTTSRKPSPSQPATSTPITTTTTNITHDGSNTGSTDRSSASTASVGMIAGVAGGIMLVLVVILSACLYTRRRDQRKGRSRAKLEHVRYENPMFRATGQSLDEVSRSRLTFVRKLGEGNFGEVHLAKTSPPTTCGEPALPEYVAVKVSLAGGCGIEFQREVEHLRAVQGNVHVVVLFGENLAQSPELIVLELMVKGNLRDHLIKGRCGQGAFGLSALLRFSWQVCDGMMYIASKGIIHGDVAARNVLVSADDMCKISDFGLARRVDCGGSEYTQAVALPVRWMALEALQYGTFSICTDVWSFGVLMWEIFTLGSTPFQSDGVSLESGAEIVTYLSEGKRLPVPDQCPPKLAAAMQESWKAKAMDRPTFAQLETLLQVLLKEDHGTRSAIYDRVYDFTAPGVAGGKGLQSVDGGPMEDPTYEVPKPLREAHVYEECVQRVKAEVAPGKRRKRAELPTIYDNLLTPEGVDPDRLYDSKSNDPSLYEYASPVDRSDPIYELGDLTVGSTYATPRGPNGSKGKKTDIGPIYELGNASNLRASAQAGGPQIADPPLYELAASTEKGDHGPIYSLGNDTYSHPTEKSRLSVQKERKRLGPSITLPGESSGLRRMHSLSDA
jgi:serine/threonine protein kinase